MRGMVPHLGPCLFPLPPLNGSVLLVRVATPAGCYEIALLVRSSFLSFARLLLRRFRCLHEMFDNRRLPDRLGPRRQPLGQLGDGVELLLAPAGLALPLHLLGEGGEGAVWGAHLPSSPSLSHPAGLRQYIRTSASIALACGWNACTTSAGRNGSCSAGPPSAA